MGLNMEEDQDLGVIVKKHESGIFETNKGHKCTGGKIGDTLMKRTDRSTYILTKEEVAERKAAAKPTETSTQKKARLAAEAQAKADEDARLAAEAQAKADEDARLAAEAQAKAGAEE